MSAINPSTTVESITELDLTLGLQSKPQITFAFSFTDTLLIDNVSEI